MVSTTIRNNYVLTFRCVNCDRQELSANYSSDCAMREIELRSRIYQVYCKGCGWKGEACGLSAVNILGAAVPQLGGSFAALR